MGEAGEGEPLMPALRFQKGVGNSAGDKKPRLASGRAGLGCYGIYLLLSVITPLMSTYMGTPSHRNRTVERHKRGPESCPTLLVALDECLLELTHDHALSMPV